MIGVTVAGNYVKNGGIKCANRNTTDSTTCRDNYLDNAYLRYSGYYPQIIHNTFRNFNGSSSDTSPLFDANGSSYGLVEDNDVDGSVYTGAYGINRGCVWSITGTQMTFRINKIHDCNAGGLGQNGLMSYACDNCIYDGNEIWNTYGKSLMLNHSGANPQVRGGYLANTSDVSLYINGTTGGNVTGVTFNSATKTCLTLDTTTNLVITGTDFRQCGVTYSASGDSGTVFAGANPGVTLNNLPEVELNKTFGNTSATGAAVVTIDQRGSGHEGLNINTNNAAATQPFVISNTDSTAVFSVDKNGAATALGDIARAGANAQAVTIKELTELTTIANATTTDTTIQIPANAIVLAVPVRVTVAIPTATTFTVIGTSSSTVFNTAAVSVNLNSTDPGTKAGAYYNATAQTIRITPNGTPGTANGRLRVTIFYIEATPPTS